MSLSDQFCRYCGAKLPAGDSASKLCPQCARTNVFSPPTSMPPAARNDATPRKNVGMILVAICVLGVILMGAMTKYYAARSVALSAEISELRDKDNPPQALIEELKESRDSAINSYMQSSLWKTLVMIACFITGFIGAVLMIRSHDDGERKLGFAALLVLLLAVGYCMSADLNYLGTFIHYARF